MRPWPKKKKPIQILPTPDYAPQLTLPSHHRTQWGTARPLVLLPGGQGLSQQANLHPLPGQVGFAGDRPEDLDNSHHPIQHEEPPIVDHGNFIMDFSLPDTLSNHPSSHLNKRKRQAKRWQDEVIPRLIKPYLELLRISQSLYSIPPSDDASLPACTCSEDRRTLTISILRFSAIEELVVRSCACQPAPDQLLACGLFPCAPVAPTLAVDIRVLDFVRRLFVHLPPNHTAWCDATEDFLGNQGYKLQTRTTLRRRFEVALHWYTTLQQSTRRYINQVQNVTRKYGLGWNDGILRTGDEDTAGGGGDEANDEASSGFDEDIFIDEDFGQQAVQEDESTPMPESSRPGKRQQPQPFPEPTARDRPSDYLCARCPLCFGGESRFGSLSDPNVIVCLDACFTQKRNKKCRDPTRFHPESYFIPEPDAEHMQDLVDSTRSSVPRQKKHRTERQQAEPSDVEDGYEGPLKVPISVLNECEASFTAADERREKASSQYFDDTALMALLCRHDRVLWLVNMRSAGEKRHYALVLLETLFQHLPLSYIIGILYDIGCQLHRSCIKWGYLERYLHRIIFGISVFHAFGHQWPCQVIYHPRKCIGFGLSDGEGCERFWHSISKLIGVLRVSGYHQRLYTLDSQVQHAEQSSLLKLGAWLLRRIRHVRSKRETAQKRLRDSGQKEDVLRAQWALQVASQTQPLPQRSKKIGKDAIEQALRSRKMRDNLQERVRDLQSQLLDPTLDACLLITAEMEHQKVKEDLKKVQQRVRDQEAKLGVDELSRLSHLTKSPFIQHRMNARALKIRLRAKLRSRKFEYDAVERGFRRQRNDQKIDRHTEASVKRRDPGIQQLARSYNKLCDEMQALISKRRAPKGAVCPDKIELSGLFSLDVDDAIWQDIGLDDGDSAAAAPSLWLVDETTREGIQALLELDRCLEEEVRLIDERRAMQEWFSEEWNVVNLLIECSDDQNLQYELQMHRKALCGLYATWISSVQSLQTGTEPLPSWGPTQDDLLNTKVDEVTAGWGHVNGQVDDKDDDNFSVSSEEDIDVGLVGALDALDLVYSDFEDEL